MSGKSVYKRIFRRIMQLLLILLILAVVSSVSLIILSQSKDFRHWAIEKILLLAESSLEANIAIDDIQFASLEGIEVYDFTMIAAGDTLASARKIAVDIDLLQVFDGDYIVRNAAIYSPRIKLLRSAADSSWNFEHIAKPSEDTTKSDAKLFLRLKRFALSDAYFIVKDSTAAPDSTGKFNPLDLAVADFDVELSALVNQADSLYRLDVEKISLREASNRLNLHKLAFFFELKPDGLKLENFSIATDNTNINIDARADSVNIFSPDQFDSTRFANMKTMNPFANSRLEFSADIRLDNPDDLQYFRAAPDAVNGDYSLNFELAGNLNRVKLNSLSLKSGSTLINIEGYAENLHDLDNIYYDAKILPSRIMRDELIARLPFFDASKIPKFEKLWIKRVTARGGGDYLRADLDIETALGSVKGEGEASGFKSENLQYSAKIEFEGVNPGLIASKEVLAGALNGSIVAEGAGTNLNSMNLTASLELRNSLFYKLSFESLDLQAHIDKGIIKLDTLGIRFARSVALDAFGDDDFKDKRFDERRPYIGANAGLDLRNAAKPRYYFNSDLIALDLTYLLNNPKLPELLSARFDVEGEGFELDSLSASVYAAVDECLFENKALIPFDLTIEADRFADGRKTLNVDSDFLNLDMTGKYEYSTLIPTMKAQGLYFAEHIKSKFKSVANSIAEADSSKKLKLEPIAEFAPIDISVVGQIRDIPALNLLTPDANVYFPSKFSFSLHSEAKKSHLSIDSIDIEQFAFESEKMKITTSPMKLKARLDMRLVDSVPRATNFSFYFGSDGKIAASDLIIEKPEVSIVYDGENAGYDLSAAVNNMIDFRGSGGASFYDDHIEATLDEVDISYMKQFTWTAAKPIIVSYGSNGASLEQFELVREGAERISAVAVVKDTIIEDATLQVSGVPLNDFLPFMPPKQRELIDSLQGSIDAAIVKISGAFASPKIETSLNAGGVGLNNLVFGDVATFLKYENRSIVGDAEISSDFNSERIDFFKISVNALPIDLSFANVKERFHRDFPIDIVATSEDLPLEMAAPFATGVQRLDGKLDMRLQAFGFYPDDLDYYGFLNIDKASFILEPTNIKYYLGGGINIEKDLITTDNLTLANDPGDGGGKAFINAELTLFEFKPERFDVKVKTKRLKVLSPASIKSSPMIYGDLDIATGANPIRIHGGLESPRLEGDISILSADLTMPQPVAAQSSKSNLQYVVENNNLRFYYNESDSSNLAKPPLKDAGQPEKRVDYAKAMGMDFRAFMPGRFTLTMDLGGIGQLYAEIGVSDPSEPLRYVKKPGEIMPELFGELVVFDRSTLKLYKIFNAEGNISFPTGSINNPALDLKASFSGQSFVGDAAKNYEVKIYITGTKENPNIRFDYSINGQPATGDSTSIAQDAIFLLLFNKTKQDFTQESSAYRDIGSSAANSIISKSLTDFVSGSRVFTSAEIDLGDFSTGGLDQAKIKLTGQLAGSVRWQIGGSVADFAGSNEISVEAPLSAFIRENLLNKVILQMTHSTIQANTQTYDQKDWEVKIKYGQSW